MSPVLLFVLFFVILLFAFPISVTMGITSILPWLVDHSFAANLIVVLRQMMSGVNSLPLLAIPMFMLSGTIMAKGGISKKLFDVFTYFVGNVVGGVPCAVIITLSVLWGYFRFGSGHRGCRGRHDDPRDGEFGL